MVRDFGAKLRITAAALGCASQKDLCARFHAVNPGTTFELDRSYKWMQGRALPRSVGLYEDWAKLLGTGRPLAWLQSCTADEFLELVCDRHQVSRDALAARARTQAQRVAFGPPFAFVLELALAFAAAVMLDHAIAPGLAFLFQPQPGRDAAAVRAWTVAAEFHRAAAGCGRRRTLPVRWRCIPAAGQHGDQRQ